MLRPAWATSLFGLLLLVGAIFAVRLYLPGSVEPEALAVTPRSRMKLADIPFNGAQAAKYLEEICALGPRVSGTAAMAAQQKLLVDYFTKLGAQVETQAFQARHPMSDEFVDLANLIVHWHPERKERVLFTAHYDTRPIPDHIKLRNIGKIPTCDVIDFDDPHWHTARDTPNKCSVLSLAKVDWGLEEWRKDVEKKSEVPNDEGNA